MDRRRAQIIGTGLMGGSIGLGLRAAGWQVTGHDHRPEAAERARELGAIDAVGADPDASLVVLAVPVGLVGGAAVDALSAYPNAVVTDVGSVKGGAVEQIGAAGVDASRFVGGHPMAGSEQEGVEGSTAAMFQGAVWVLTPTDATAPEAYTLVHQMVTTLGADVVTLGPAEHDEMVAVVSHVPHLTAATLMRVAAGRSDEHAALLRLAAGGFRDMTRIASGHPGIWPDICAANRDAIVRTLDALVDELQRVRTVVASGDRTRLWEQLDLARRARRSLPTSAPVPELLVELRVGVSDRPGQLAAVTTTATELGVNIYDLELAHSAEGNQGVMILVVDAAAALSLEQALVVLGYRVAVTPLESPLEGS